jgi:uncharacterized protein (UPF0332 family)
MDSWDDMAAEGLSATNILIEKNQWRSCVSRAYYATYAKAVATLIRTRLTMPIRGNPAHERLPLLLMVHLRQLSQVRRANLAGVIASLYKLRIGADYGPQMTFNRRSAFAATGLMTQAYRDLEEANHAN